MSYMAARLADGRHQRARVVMTARCDGTVVGSLMARADLGDFGRAEPVAVLDTIGVDPRYARRGVGGASRSCSPTSARCASSVETIGHASPTRRCWASCSQPASRRRNPFTRSLKTAAWTRPYRRRPGARRAAQCWTRRHEHPIDLGTVYGIQVTETDGVQQLQNDDQRRLPMAE